MRWMLPVDWLLTPFPILVAESKAGPPSVERRSTKIILSTRVSVPMIGIFATEAFATPELNIRYSMRKPSRYETWLMTTTARNRSASLRFSFPETGICQNPSTKSAPRADARMQFCASALRQLPSGSSSPRPSIATREKISATIPISSNNITRMTAKGNNKTSLTRSDQTKGLPVSKNGLAPASKGGSSQLGRTFVILLPYAPLKGSPLPN
mmetsp:Transcript_39731/g.86500  ORF Transcript_39731/g.86500 Transcript_39731/m.86500 type:complete len:211 (-) Transcript_39731:126-758(-)